MLKILNMVINNEFLMLLLKEKFGKKARVFLRNGKIVVAMLPDPSKRKSTAKQVAARRRMKKVSAHVKELFKDPGVKAMYAARADVGQNAFNMAVKDYYKKMAVTSS